MAIIPKFSNKFTVSFWLDSNTPFNKSAELASQLVTMSSFPVYIGPHLDGAEGEIDILFEDDSQNIVIKALQALADARDFIVKISTYGSTDSMIELIQLDNCVIDAVQKHGFTYQVSEALHVSAQITYQNVTQKLYK